jgi:tetratricopeptide (TPR) repeat protein
MTRALLAAALLALAGALPLPALAQDYPEAVRLLQRAEFWQGRGRDDLAREEVAKLLRLVPDHAEGLVLQARLQLRANQAREAEATLERLRRAHPAHPGVAQIAALLRIRGPDRDKLRTARQLGRAGRNDEAIKAYRALFPDGFPDDEIALEYAQVLAGTRAGREEGGALIAELAQRHPQDARYQVAHAADMSRRRPVSAATLHALRELSAHASVSISRPAREAWRRAVLAMDPVEASLPALREYIASSPGETAVQERLEEVTRIIASGRGQRTDPAPAPTARREGWAALEAGRLGEADTYWQDAIARDPKDAEATGGLGLVRLRQGRHAEARELFERARRLEPANAAKWDGLVTTARYWGLMQQARAAREAGRFDEAQARAREAAALDPKEPESSAELGRIRLEQLRARAKPLIAEGRSAEAIAVLEEAAALDPDDPWLRLDLARLYAAGNAARRGEELFEALLRRRPGDADARFAFAIYLSSIGRESDALVTLEAITPAARTEAMTRMQRRTWIAVQGRRAEGLAQGGDRTAADRVVADVRDSVSQGATREEAESVAQLRLSFTLGRIDTLLDQGDFAGARPLVDAALVDGASDPRVLGQAGRLAIREGRVGDAVAYEQRAMALEKDNEGWRYRRLAELIDQQSRWYGSALDWLYRSGTPGKSKISAQELPIAGREGWSASGRSIFRVAPARVSSGLLDITNSFEASTYGSLLLCLPQCADAPLASQEKGVALAVGYEHGNWRVDAGTSPLGFPVVNLLGGLQYRGELGPMSYTIDAARRPLPSSLLSYAGVRDPNTGRVWGGVVTTGVRVNVSRDSGGDYGAWGVGGLYRLSGQNVQDNDKGELMGGLYRRFVNEEDRQLTAGVTGMLWHFSENAGEYTFGHGGYYSPKSYQSLSFPLSYGWRSALTSFYVRASVSVSWSNSRRAAFFPTDAEMQARAEALAPVTGVDPFYAGGDNGRSYGRSFAAAAEQQVAPSLFFGARVDIERSTNYTPSRFVLYLRYTPDGPAARPVSLPPEQVLFGFPY